MNPTPISDQPIEKPCRHMEGFLNRHASGRSKWLVRLYVLAHTARCGPCRRFLQALEGVLDGLKMAKPQDPSAETMDRLLSQIERADEK